MEEANSAVEKFFDNYAAALLARDEKAVATMYAVPSLILFPGTSIAVSDEKQTEEFFATTWGQYEGVDSVEHDIRILGEAPHSVWADVTWSWDGQPRERLCYQLVDVAGEYRIAVLTPLE